MSSSTITIETTSMNRKLSPTRIVLLYTVVGLAWIFFSDSTLSWLVKDLERYAYAGMAKGFLFVMATAGMLHLLLLRFARQLATCRQTSHQAGQVVEKLANFDTETGLPNINLLRDRMNQLIALKSRNKDTVVVILVCMTGYKSVVDARGHDAGFEVIRTVAGRMVSALRQYDTVARIQHDEFAIVLGDTVAKNDVGTILNKLQKVFAEPLQMETFEAIITACFGVACFPTDGISSDLLLRNAHIAMNQARQNGLCCQYFSEELNREAVERHSLESGMLRAIDDGEFFICYQPKVDIEGREVIGMEALVRWQRPGEGVIPPDKFIPLAEKNGLIVRLGTFVLREACRQNRAWQDAGLPKLKVSVNISGRQVLDNAFVTQITGILDETGLEPRYLELELTESVLMNDADDTILKLVRLKEMGISISVDDFGTGYSSLSYLKHLPIDTVKIDRSFVRDVVEDPDDAAIVEAIIAMARSLKLKVVAEGVETFEQLAFLRQCECQQAQGYYFSKPLVPHHFEYFLRTGTAEVATSGTLTFDFSPDLSSFEGVWSYDGQPEWSNIWNGTLVESEGDGAVRRYRTNYGTLELITQGEKVTGSYPHNDSRIEGVMRENRLSGTWMHKSSGHYAPAVPPTSKKPSHRDDPDTILNRPEPGHHPSASLIVADTIPEFIGEIAVSPDPVLPGDTIPIVLNRLQNDVNLLVLPVVEESRVVGVINRSKFIEEHVIGRHGFGFHINHSRKIRELMDPVELTLESTTPIEEAARLIQMSRQSLTRMNNIFVLSRGRYYGIVNLNKLFNAITVINLTLAKGANPLTGLPGNESIQREISGRLVNRKPFDISYIDIDNFKPYNDYYGFQKGDVVIKTLGDIIAQVLGEADSSSFCGHIGGDDFIIITEPYQAETVLTRVIAAFGKQLPLFHGETDFSAGCYHAINRRGEQETFGLLSISIGIVNTLLTPVESYAQLASVSTEVKKAAKKIPGSSLVLNQRKLVTGKSGAGTTFDDAGAFSRETAGEGRRSLVA